MEANGYILGYGEVRRLWKMYGVWCKIQRNKQTRKP